MRRIDILVQLEDADYQRLKSDADDNRQFMSLIRMVILFIVFSFFFFCWGKPLIDLDIQRRQLEQQQQMNIVEAENNVRIREIESEGMDFDDYIHWLYAREKG